VDTIVQGIKGWKAAVLGDVAQAKDGEGPAHTTWRQSMQSI